MAETNVDGSRASAGQRAYNFMSNGGGTVTFRMVVPILLSILGAVLILMWNDLRDGQNKVIATVTDQGKSIVTNSARIDAMQSGQQRIWLKLGQHDQQIDDVKQRVTHLEACQPICAPK